MASFLSALLGGEGGAETAAGKGQAELGKLIGAGGMADQPSPQQGGTKPDQFGSLLQKLMSEGQLANKNKMMEDQAQGNKFNWQSFW